MDVEIDYDSQKLIVGTFGRAMYSYDISFLNLVQPPLSVNELNNLEFDLYPNPAQNNLFVSGINSTSYRIFNTLGKEVLNGEIESKGEIKIDGLESGVYFLKIGESTKRFVISY